MNPLTAVPPAFLLFALAAVVAVIPRRVGNALAVAGGVGVAVWLLVIPAGTHLDVPLFGFDAVLLLVDGYSRPVGVVFGVIAATGAGYAATTDADRRQTAYALAYVGAGLGAALAGDWLSLVVFWELMALFATLLLWHRSEDRSAGTRYAIYHEIGALTLIAGVLLHYAAAGSFLYGNGITAGLPAVLVGLGIGLNAGFLGLHVWIVDAYSRTHIATSAVLAAITTKVGAYALVRAFPDGHAVLAYVGGAMVVFGVCFAILQTDVRRLLSYHIVSQVGYMVAGFGAGAALSQAGAMAHLVNHVLYKSLLFMVAGVIVARTGTGNLKKLGGLRGGMPLTAVLFAVAAFSIAGVPGFNGFVSKAMVLDGVEKAGYEVLWYLLLLGGVGTVVSFAKFGYYAFYHRGDTDPPDLSRAELGVLGSLAFGCLLLGLAPWLLFDLLPATGVSYAKPFAVKQFLKAAGVTVGGLVLFALVRKPLGHVTPVGDIDRVYTPAGRWLLRVSVDTGVWLETAAERTNRLATQQTQRLRRRIKDVPVPPTLSVGSSQSIGAGILAAALVLAVILLVAGV